jgi:hypothetical protein
MFDQHSFRKEKCKACGLSWVEHKDCIPESLVVEFFAARQNKIESKGRIAGVVQAEREKKRSKSRITEEHSWLFEKSKHSELAESDSEEESCFKMVTQEEIISAPRPVVDQQLKVTNLIDFSECDLPHNEIHALEIPSQTPCVSATAWDVLSSQDQWLHEIHHLRQMLRDADAEKSIQISMARDEVATTIDELNRQIKEKDSRLECARQEIAELKAQISKNVATECPERGDCTRWTAQEVNACAKIGQDLPGFRLSSSYCSDSCVDRRCLSHGAELDPAVSRPGGAQSMGRHAALALKEAIREMHEVRINAEMQFAWISKRIRTTEGRMKDAKISKSIAA